MGPILKSRIWSRLQAGIDESEALFRAHAFSPSLSAGETAVCLFFPDGGAWIEGSFSAPFQSALLAAWVDAVGSRLSSPDTLFLSNDPYDGGGTLFDIKMIRAVEMGTHGTALLAIGGHYPDVGGRSVGGVAPEVTSVQEEGVRIPFREADSGLFDLMAANCRYADAFRGDVSAQQRAVDVGCEWLDKLAATYSWEAILAASHTVRERSRDAYRAARTELKSGQYARRDRLDDGSGSETFLRLEIAATVSEDSILVDFAGSADRSAGPTNCTRASVAAASLCGMRQIFPEIPACAFAIDDLEILAPSGSLLAAVYPTPVGGTSSILAERVASLVLEALSQAVHGRGRACDGGGGNVLVLDGQDTRRPFSLRLVAGAGGGASGRGDGLNNGDPITRLSAFPSVESMERTYPVRVTCYAERESSGGSGRYRGGEGTLLEIVALADRTRLTIYMDRFSRGAGGHHRGGRGQTSEIEVFVDGRWQTPPGRGRCQDLDLVRGDRVRLRSAGGGGYGHPYERAIRLVSEDVVSGRLTRKLAAKQHGVVYTSPEDRDYDSAKTFKLRSYRLTSSDVDDYLDEIETLED
jgi:N-methylhydantoinase B